MWSQSAFSNNQIEPCFPGPLLGAELHRARLSMPLHPVSTLCRMRRMRSTSHPKVPACCPERRWPPLSLRRGTESSLSQDRRTSTLPAPPPCLRLYCSPRLPQLAESAGAPHPQRACVPTAPGAPPTSAPIGLFEPQESRPLLLLRPQQSQPPALSRSQSQSHNIRTPVT